MEPINRRNNFNGIQRQIFTLDKGVETISTYEKLHSVFDDLLGKENVINHIEYIHDNASLKEKD